MTLIRQATEDTMHSAAQALRDGQVVVIPTETVYGLAANALDDQAVLKIFATKNRPAINPLIIHVSTLQQAEQYAQFHDKARKLAHEFWPGPLTMILTLRRESGISPHVTAGLDTIALRVPAHPVARAILNDCALPLAAPSANASGEPSATTPQHAVKSLGDQCPMVIADGICSVGLESTVLDFTSAIPTILRAGAITQDDIECIIGTVHIELTPQDKPKSPGQLLKHYAPSCPVRLKAVDVKAGEALLAFGSIRFMGVSGGGAAANLPEDSLRNLSETGDLEEAARNLFRYLRDLDQPHHTAIAVMDIPQHGIGLAINERLSRAAGKV